jgi:hypothetical protein
MTAVRQKPLKQTRITGSIAVTCAAVLAGCSSSAPSADRLELATIHPGYVIPKSSPRQLVAGFDRYCVKTPGNPEAKETALRDGGYVPTNTTNGKTRRVFVIDNKRPAIAIGSDMCMARATSRTGQTNAVSRYIAATFPEATPMDTSDLTIDVEQAWAVEGGILATARNRWSGNRSSYSVILFQPKAEDA